MAVWYPYTQMKHHEKNLVVTSAKGAEITLDTGETLIDAVSSWWCVIHGYNHPELNQAVTDQLHRMSHVMLGGLTHNPAEALAEKLVEITPKELRHVFYSDSGSVGCEVGLKMAIQYWRNLGELKKKHFIALKGGYHGDTLGVMSVGTDDETMHAAFTHVLAKQHIVTPGDLKELESVLKEHHEQIAGMIVEPLMQGAAGFKLHSAEYISQAKALCETYNVLFIADEVATGFCRTGTLFAMNQTSVSPDIMVLGKGLTAGYIGLAATLASEKIFQAFYSDDASDAFMHGPTFMGNPLACAVALKSIELIESEETLKKVRHIETYLKKSLSTITSSAVKEVRVFGAMACLEFYDGKLPKNAQQVAKDHGVWLRPFGNVAYTMPPYCIADNQLESVCQVLHKLAG
jgi:adenosylmethionine-8-amino-7-oxononanoate aminotransferase